MMILISVLPTSSSNNSLNSMKSRVIYFIIKYSSRPSVTEERFMAWVKFQVLTASNKKMTVFWNVLLCSLVKTGRRFRCPYCFIVLMIGAVGTSEKVGLLQRHHTALHPRRLWSSHKCFFSLWNGPRVTDEYCLHQDDRPDDGRGKHLWNVGPLQRDYTALYPRQPSS
jgi:hypothetical protein